VKSNESFTILSSTSKLFVETGSAEVLQTLYVRAGGKSEVDFKGICSLFFCLCTLAIFKKDNT